MVEFTPEDVPAYLEAKKTEQVEIYLKGGRVLRDTETGILIERYLSIIKVAATDLSSFDTKAMDDIAAELTLRSVAVPTEQVAEELKIIGRALSERMQNQTAERRQEIGAEIEQEGRRLLGMDLTKKN